MKYSISFNCLPEEEKNDALLRSKAVKALRKQGISIGEKQISSFVFKKKSIDARKRDIKLFLRYDVYTDGDKPEDDQDAEFLPHWKNVRGEKRVLIIGAGPAGLFAALTLLEAGIKPIIVERGPETSQRKRDIADISRTGVLNIDSNYCFGEGGAGTFSDGKLFSRSAKRGNIGRVLQILAFHGADGKILTDAHPHIGTDKLPVIIDNIKKTIVSYGGEIYFNSRCTEILTEKKSGVLAAAAAGDKPVETCVIQVICGVKVVDTHTGEERVIKGDKLILACGHSAPDIYKMLEAVDKKALEAKTFAVGVRVEHPREVIDKIQYHGRERGEVLPAAEYRLTTQVDGRGVYSFCMCPGGLVVPSASSPDGVVVNGMSPSSRNAYWSNAAIVVECRPEDYVSWGDFPSDPLAGLNFRTQIEQAAKKAATQAALDRQGALDTPMRDGKPINPQTAPAQKLTDFLAGKVSETLPKTSYTPGISSVNLDEVLPEHISKRLKEGFHAFDQRMKGFVCGEALLIAPETRTSTPVRILRDAKTLESPSIKGLFPAGEGSGYAGGIVSSAMDGENSAKAIISAVQKAGK
ncbi:MAG: FAD-dependent monooxygenase [Treponemataceae bacterium]|nr:FAD-dependent monooxygenase [Treponemataceae bacterium]